jgi:4-diphosphocytidyl-2-C-methyl-D-erythritol kinase
MTCRSISCRSAAKINLTLDVMPLRADFYHELRSVVHTIGLYDKLTFNFGGKTGLHCNIPGLSGDDNLCLRAQRGYYRAAGLDEHTHPVGIELQKVIPSGAGLGGGSGNAASTLLVLNRHFAALSGEQLAMMAATLGADVPLFLRGGAQLMEGFGERLKPLPALHGWVVLVKPRGHGDTAQVFGAWDNLHSAARSPDATAALLAKWPAAANAPDHLIDVANALHNDLERAAALVGADSAPLLSALRAAGALGARMTGSGSACYGLFAEEGAARAARDAFELPAERTRYDIAGCWVIPFCEHGVVFEIE